MTDAAYRLQALVLLREGMRLFYDCPLKGDSFEADNFFGKYKGKTAIIASFPMVFVGPLDSKGRLPGMYLKSKSINVQFEGEEQVHYGLNLHHFVLLDPTTTVTDAEYEAAQRAGDLPRPVEFYPSDTVRKGDDLLQVPRVVQEVQFNDKGGLLYVLAETQEAKDQRKAEKDARLAEEWEKLKANPDRLPRMLFSGHDFPQTETCKGSNLVLIERGPVYFLYNEPEKLSFASPEEELNFWAHDGLSRTFYDSRHGVPHWEWSLEMAREILGRGEGDLILSSRPSRSRSGEMTPRYTVRKLHPCFDQYRGRVREIALSVTEPPLEQERSMQELSRGLLEIGRD
ncbi:MAG: hypothetical protein AAB582_01710 [Patescibacteria group bacterium]